MATELRSTIAETNHNGVMKEIDDSLIEQIWHDLDKQVTREQIRQVITEIAADFRSATVTAFVPIFIRRQAREKLKARVNDSRNSALYGREAKTKGTEKPCET
jgi:hypothetical protein